MGFGNKTPKPKPPKRDKAGWMKASDYAKYAAGKREQTVRKASRKRGK